MNTKYFCQIVFALLFYVLVQPSIVYSQVQTNTERLDQEYVNRAKNAILNQDFDQAAKILKNGSDRGFIECTYQFADLAHFSKNYKIAYDYYLKASLLGHHISQMQLALLYYDGLGTKKDVSKSYFWIATAAKSGYQPAIKLCSENLIKYNHEQYGLSSRNLLFHGYQKPTITDKNNQGTKMGSLTTSSESEISHNAKTALRGGDFDKAITLLTQGVEAGYPSCAYDLAMLRYLGGKYSIAHDLFLQAALKGHADSQYMLSTLYLKGQGVSRNTHKSNYWLGTAAKSGNESAINSCAEKGINCSLSEYGLTFTNLVQHGYK